MPHDQIIRHLQIEPPCYPLEAPHGNLEVSWACSEADVRDAQRLRYSVFAGEMGARLPAVSHHTGLDCDRFDDYCDHLLVRKAEGDGALVGTYRVLSASAAFRAGGFYSDKEFDLAPLRLLRHAAVELGRSCVRPCWRTGGVILALWRELGKYMLRHRLNTMIGCASIGMRDGGTLARGVWNHTKQHYLIGEQWRVRPRHPLILTDEELSSVHSDQRFFPGTPPLIKGYLRCGAKILGPPAIDSAFNTADLPIILRLDHLAPRYRQHFLGTQ